MREIPSIPYTILVMASFATEIEEPWSDGLLEFDSQEPDSILAALHSSIFISLPTSLCPTGGLKIVFSKGRDFTPDGLIVCQPFLSDLVEAGKYLDDAVRKKISVDEIQQGLAKWPNLPPVHFAQASRVTAKTPQSKTLDAILSIVALPDEGRKTRVSLPNGYNEILVQILNQIFSDPAFRMMESAWQGLQLLAHECATDNNIRLLLVPVSQSTFESTVDALLPSLVQDPLSLLLVDLPFDGSSNSMSQLNKLADLSQSLLVPALAWITPNFFQVSTWDDFDRLAFLPHHMAQQMFSKWKKLHQSPAGRWLCLLCNRFLYRYPYGPDNRPRNIDFIETGRPWLAPVWAAAKLISQRVSRSKWPTGTSAWQTNRLEDMALDMSKMAHPAPVEKVFANSRLEQLERCGIVALTSHQGSDSVFLSSNTMVSSGSSLDYQSLICLVTRFTLWCKDTFTEDIRGEELAAALKQAWKSYQDHQQTSYEDMEMKVRISDSGQQATVHLEWLPSRRVLLSGQELVLEFTW
jgi:type VI secretion system protein ImpC